MKREEKNWNWNKHQNKYSTNTIMCGSFFFALLCFWFLFPLWTNKKLFSLLKQRQRRRRCSQQSMIEQEPTEVNIRCLKLNEKVLCSKPSSPSTFSNWFFAKAYNGTIQCLKSETNNIVKNSSIRTLSEYCFRKSSKSHISNRITDSTST